MRHRIIAGLIGILFTILSFSVTAAEAYRLKATLTTSEYQVQGTGTAFAVDASKYGYKAKRTLMTCYHCVGGFSKLEIEIDYKYQPVKVLEYNVDLDVALLEVGTDLEPKQLGNEDALVGDKITLYGCPQGIPVQEFKGKVRSLFYVGKYTDLEIKFDHGDSGAPVYNKDGKIVAMAAASPRVGEKDIDHNCGLCIPLGQLITFLRSVRK